MKNLKLFLVAIVLFVGTTAMNAQSKMAHIDTQALIEAMPAMKTAQSELEKIKKTYDTEIKSLAKELDTKIKQYEAEADSKTDEENGKRVQEVQGMKSNIDAYRQQALQDLQKKEIDIFKPVLEKARAAIQKVARAQGYEYVMDSSNGAGLLLADGKDLLGDVKKDLGI